MVIRVESRESLPAHVDDAFAVLKRAFDHEQTRGLQQRAVLLKHLWQDDGVGDAGLVFECDEEKSLRRGGALTPLRSDPGYRGSEG